MCLPTTSRPSFNNQTFFFVVNVKFTQSFQLHLEIILHNAFLLPCNEIKSKFP